MNLRAEDLNFQDDSNTILEFDSVSDNVCFGTWKEMSQYEAEQGVLYELRKPKVRPLKASDVIRMDLPRKIDPWKNKRETPLPQCPENVFLPRKKLPWEK